MFLKTLRRMKKRTAEINSANDMNATNVPGIVDGKPLPPLVYGLNGICELFKCSKTTAWRYYHTVIADACTQRGHKIVVNTKKALELFGVNDINVEELPEK